MYIFGFKNKKQALSSLKRLIDSGLKMLSRMFFKIMKIVQICKIFEKS